MKFEGFAHHVFVSFFLLLFFSFFSIFSFFFLLNFIAMAQDGGEEMIGRTLPRQICATGGLCTSRLEPELGGVPHGRKTDRVIWMRWGRGSGQVGQIEYQNWTSWKESC